MKTSLDQDKKNLMDLSQEKLIQLLLMQIRNLWSEDGLYFLGIENRWGTDAAIEVDREVWAVMGKLEARRVTQALDLRGNGLPELFEAIKHTSWWLYLDEKEFELDGTRLVIRNNHCKVQEARVNKGLGEFDCKPVRNGFLDNFMKEFNPNIMVRCRLCPPDAHPQNLYCEWEFILE